MDGLAFFWGALQSAVFAGEEAHRTPHGKRPLVTENQSGSGFFFIDIDKKMTLVKFHPFLLFDREGDFISPMSYIVQPFFQLYYFNSSNVTAST